MKTTMVTQMDFMELCRLCLAEDQINVSIFGKLENQSDILHKITVCLPIMVQIHDELPKNICQGCVDKLHLLYQFHNTAISSEKQLLSWLNDTLETKADAHFSATSTQLIIPKEEPITSVADDYLMEQEPHNQKAPFVDNKIIEETVKHPAKRLRRSAAKVAKHIIESDDDEDVDDPTDIVVIKTEDDSEIERGMFADISDQEDYSTQDFADHKDGIMEAIKYEIPDCVSILNTDALIEFQSKQNICSIEKIVCKICNTAFAERISLERHLEDCYMRVRGACGQTFTGNDTLLEHKLTHEAPSSSTHKKQREKSECHRCRFCKINYKFPAELRYHILTHTTVKHYLCSYCGNNFSLSRPSQCERTHSRHGHTHFNKKTDKKRNKVMKTQSRFGCAVCKKTFRWKISLINHKRCHTGVYECSYCSKRFTSQSNLTKHKRTHTGDKSYESSYYSKRCNRQNTLARPERNHTGERPYKCSDCSKRFRYQSNLTTHQRIHTGEKPYECSHCSKSFTNQSNHIAHERTHTGEKPYECPHCSKRFRYRSNLTTHEFLHTGEKLYECSHCSKGFTDRSNFIKHERIHTGEKPYVCSLCSKPCTTKPELAIHMRTHTGEKPYECSHCCKRFTHQSALVRHERIHTGEKPYECSNCSKCFARQSHLTVHIRTHTGEKPYKCLHCNKGFTCQSSLKTHGRIHTGDKPYVCSLCGKPCTTKIELTRHMRTHTGERPYECPHCTKRFCNKSNLTIHERIHTGEKPYECSDCNRRFTSQSCLTIHKRTHTGENSYSCSLCSKGFPRRSHLNSHMRIHIE